MPSISAGHSNRASSALCNQYAHEIVKVNVYRGQGALFAWSFREGHPSLQDHESQSGGREMLRKRVYNLPMGPRGSNVFTFLRDTLAGKYIYQHRVASLDTLPPVCLFLPLVGGCFPPKWWPQAFSNKAKRIFSLCDRKMQYPESLSSAATKQFTLRVVDFEAKNRLGCHTCNTRPRIFPDFVSQCSHCFQSA